MPLRSHSARRPLGRPGLGGGAPGALGAGTHLREGPLSEDHQQRRLPAAAVAHQHHLDRPRARRRLGVRGLRGLHRGPAGPGRAARGRPAGQECGRGGAVGGSARRAAGGGGAGPGESPEAGRAGGPEGGWCRGRSGGDPRSASVLGRAPGADAEQTSSWTVCGWGACGQGKTHSPWEESRGGQPGGPTSLAGTGAGSLVPSTSGAPNRSQ